MQEMRRKDETKRKARLDELQENLREAQKELNRKRIAYDSRKAQDHIDDPNVQKERYTLALGEVSIAKKHLSEKRLDRIKVLEDVKNLQTSIDNIDTLPVTDAQLNDVLKSHPIAQQALASIAETAKQMAQIEVTAARPQDFLPALKEKLDDQERQLITLREKLRPQLVANIRHDTADKLRLQKYNLDESIKSLKKQEDYLGIEVQRREDEANRLKNHPVPLDVVALRDDIASMEHAQNKLKEMIASIRAEPVLSSRVSMLDRADVPSNRDHSRQLKIAGVAGAGLFGFCLFGVCWWECRSRRVNSADEVVSQLRMNLVGTLPALPLRARQPLAAGNSVREQHWQGQLSESVDAIRTLLLHAARTEPLQVIMITSATSGEGKTSVASQLAASLARAWRKTLLVDGDLRNPALHGLFGLPQEPGFSEVLRGEVNAADTIRPTPLSRLWLMPAGHRDNHAIQALAQDGVRTAFQKLKEQYDFIIVDSCPVLPVADAMLLGQHVDAVIFSILRDVSRLPAVYSAKQRLSNINIRTLGAVVIGDHAPAGHMYPPRRSDDRLVRG
jgi:capsular exopolysaccharide synthesis family protein